MFLEITESKKRTNQTAGGCGDLTIDGGNTLTKEELTLTILEDHSKYIVVQKKTTVQMSET